MGQQLDYEKLMDDLWNPDREPGTVAKVYTDVVSSSDFGFLDYLLHQTHDPDRLNTLVPRYVSEIMDTPAMVEILRGEGVDVDALGRCRTVEELLVLSRPTNRVIISQKYPYSGKDLVPNSMKPYVNQIVRTSGTTSGGAEYAWRVPWTSDGRASWELNIMSLIHNVLNRNNINPEEARAFLAIPLTRQTEDFDGREVPLYWHAISTTFKNALENIGVGTKCLGESTPQEAIQYIMGAPQRIVMGSISRPKPNGDPLFRDIKPLIDSNQLSVVINAGGPISPEHLSYIRSCDVGYEDAGGATDFQGIGGGFVQPGLEHLGFLINPGLPSLVGVSDDKGKITMDGRGSSAVYSLAPGLGGAQFAYSFGEDLKTSTVDGRRYMKFLGRNDQSSVGAGYSMEVSD